MLIVSDLRVWAASWPTPHAVATTSGRQALPSHDKHGSPDLYYVEDIELANIIQMYVMS